MTSEFLRERSFSDGPPNLLPSTFPYVWLPTFLVQLALFGHLLLFRRLRRAHQVEKSTLNDAAGWPNDGLHGTGYPPSELLCQRLKPFRSPSEAICTGEAASNVQLTALSLGGTFQPSHCQRHYADAS